MTWAYGFFTSQMDSKDREKFDSDLHDLRFPDLKSDEDRQNRIALARGSRNAG